MKSFADLLSHDLTNAIGWTLLHSLWQSFAVLVLVLACLRLFPSMRSSTRYAVTCAGLILFVSWSFITFLTEYGAATKTAAEQVLTHSSWAVATGSHETVPASLLTTFKNTIQTNIPLIVTFWAIGFLFFTGRLVVGLVHSRRLKNSSRPLDQAWQSFIEQAGRKLQIHRVISLAESALIHSPVVLGYFKPVILVPIGMLSGLTTEQVETIFWHELAHIKRHDYLVNLIQSAVETIFFFNPCVRMLSNEIRKEREYCCDDLVLQQHGGSRAYALALTRLAEADLRHTGIALALADDNNQLFMRIKRIMEKSAHHPGKGKFMIPLLVLIGALLCVSWLGANGQRHEEDQGKGLQGDTIPNKKLNSARYTRKSVITLDKNGKPHEEIVEDFEGDERLRPLLQQGDHGLPHAMIPMPPYGIDSMAPLSIDTIPPAPFNFHDMERWDEFSQSLEDAFTDRFGDLYGFDPADSLFFDFKGQFAFPDSDAFEGMQQQLEQLRPDLFNHFRDNFGFQFERMDGYETRLRDELIKDGYLSKDETINSLEWNNNSFKVNGKAVSPKHLKKYQALNDQFFGSDYAGKAQ